MAAAVALRRKREAKARAARPGMAALSVFTRSLSRFGTAAIAPRPSLIGARQGPISVAPASSAIAQLAHAFMRGAMRAAEHVAALLQSVTDDTSAAVGAGRRQCVDGAFEAVERVGGPIHFHLEGLVVVVA